MPRLPTDRRDVDERMARIDLMMKELSAHTDELHRLAAAVRDDSHRRIAKSLGGIAQARAQHEAVRRARTKAPT
jgi:hypothetical protein